MKATNKQIGISMPSLTPSSKVQLCSVDTSFIKNDFLINDKPVGVLDTKRPNKYF